ncbi:MAG: hypothetical protein ACLT3Y_08370 [Ruminococcus callidus]
MLLVIDSYDDLLQYARESEKAQVSAEVERVLENFMQGTEGIIRKVERPVLCGNGIPLSARDHEQPVPCAGRGMADSCQRPHAHHLFHWRG